MLRMWMFTSIFTTVFHRILDFKTGLNFYSDPFFMQKIRLPFQTASILTNPRFQSPKLFLRYHAFLGFFNFRADLSFNLRGQLRVIM